MISSLSHTQSENQNLFTVIPTNFEQWKMNNKTGKQTANNDTIKPQVLGGKDMPFPHMYNMIRVHCWNLVTVSNSYGPPIPYME